MQELWAAGCSAAPYHQGEVQVGVFQVEASGFRALGEFLWSVHAEVGLMALNLLIWLVKAGLQSSCFMPPTGKEAGGVPSAGDQG